MDIDTEIALIREDLSHLGRKGDYEQELQARLDFLNEQRAASLAETTPEIDVFVSQIATPEGQQLGS